MENFAYQFIFEYGDDDKVIFIGTTTSKCVAKLSEIQDNIRKFLGKDTFKVINITYQPINNESQTSSQEVSE